ncbi:hypothetical protein ACIQZG_22070 [Lysinibacillus sp. NPDC096418]|uniref:hypothetical protein n=1 Tax=Lysinibacillus sp. NPDC096418 TaxID=3364138 RepID=UPI0038258A08
MGKQAAIELISKSIHSGCFADKIDKEMRFNVYEDDLITDNFTASFDTCCDRSDLSQLNKEHQNGNLSIIEDITDSHYTHIVKDIDGQYYAVQFKDGDLADQ